MTGSIRNLLIAACLIPLAACTKPALVRVRQGSTSTLLSFQLSKEREPGQPLPNFAGLKVEKFACGQSTAAGNDVVWMFSAKDGIGLRPAPLEVQYGQAIQGYSSVGGTVPLATGCYEAKLFDGEYTGSVRFEVQSSGSVRELTNAR
jgi:hypothetical protein